MSLTARGVPYPASTDPNNVPVDIGAIATWVNDRPGVAALTTTQKNALTGTDRWDGKLVLDTTLDRLFRWDAGTTTWVQLPDSADIAALLATTGTPADLGVTASRGVSSSAARADHIHAWPSFQSWTPTISSGATLGNGSLTGRYIQQGKRIEGWGRFLLGTTSSVGTLPTFSVPVTGTGTWYAARADFLDAGSNTYAGVAQFVAASLITCYGLGTAGAYSASQPFTMGNTDTVEWRFVYEAV